MKKSLKFGLVAVFAFIVITSCDKSAIPTIGPVLTNPTKPTAKGKSFFVSDLIGSDANNGLTSTTPFKTIATSIAALAPGDTLFLMNGTFTTPITINKSGTVDKYITFKSLPGHNPKITVTGSGAIYSAVRIQAAYIIFEGIELAGNNANYTLAEARAAYDLWVASGINNAIHAPLNTNAISADGNGTHHVIIRNCVVHDYPAGGIGSGSADYITIENNRVYNNSWYTMFATSGISVINPFNSDAADVNKYKIIIRNNIVYNNKTEVPWNQIRRLSDGNGIIIDVNRATSTTVAYNSRTLVENNVSFNNGGSGIHAFKADHVDIINNTAYNNGTVVSYEEIFSNNSSDVKIINNIMYARTGGKWTANYGSGNVVTFSNNIHFNSAVVSNVTGTNANPQFVQLPTITNGLVVGNFNFSLSAGSPAINAGTSTIYSLSDILGIARPRGGAVDCGAYEVQ